MPYETSALALVFLFAGSACAPPPLDCGEPTSVEHASVNVHRAGNQLVAQYACEQGYYGVSNRDFFATCDRGADAWSYADVLCFPETVVDARTGLEWENKRYHQKISWRSARATCENLQLPGDGWRLPSSRELMSIYEYHPDEEEPVPDLRDDFGRHWSSTHSETFDAAFLLDLGDGTAWVADRDYLAESRCVRGPSLPGPAWTSNGDGTTTDQTTGLVWEATLTNTALVTRPAAEAHCAGLTRRGGGFRVPTMPELISAIDFETDDAGLNPAFITDAPRVTFWTSSPGWLINFDNVVFVRTTPLNGARVRCVKD